MLPPVAGEQAELTEDSMNNWDSNAPPDTPISSDNITNDITVKQKNQPDDDSGTKIDEFGRTMGSHVSYITDQTFNFFPPVCLFVCLFVFFSRIRLLIQRLHLKALFLYHQESYLSARHNKA